MKIVIYTFAVKHHSLQIIKTFLFKDYLFIVEACEKKKKFMEKRFLKKKRLQ